MKRISMRSLSLVVLSVLYPSAAIAQDYGDKSRKVDSLYAEYGPTTPGVAVRVLQRGRVVHRGEYGMANLEDGVPISSSTAFDIASVAKQFTGMAVAMLIEEGRINPEETVSAYVPDLPDFGRTITIRQLLHHTSGIRDWVRPFQLMGWKSSDTRSFDQIMGFVRRQQELNFAPGERRLYSNTNYNILAEVVQRVTETPFPTWTRENIFEPLGMTSTHVRENYWNFFPHLARSYVPLGEAYAVLPNGLTAYGSSSIITTADDLTKWLRNFETAEVGGPDVIGRMVGDTVGSRHAVGYGYGLQHFQYNGHRGFFHSGAWVGLRAVIVLVPREEFALLVIGNAGPETNLRDSDIIDIYLQGGVEDDESEILSDRTPARVDSALMDRYLGTYDLPVARQVTITRDHDGLVVHFSRGTPVPLVPLSSTHFEIVGEEVISFEVKGSDPATALILQDGTRAPRAEPFQPTTEELQEFIGTYYSEELEMTLRISMNDELGLAADYIRWGGTVRLAPSVRDEFWGSNGFMAEVRFIRDNNGVVSAMRISATRALDLRFVRVDGQNLR